MNDRKTFHLAWLLGVALLTAAAWSSWDTVVDDAYISARYAEHLATGRGLVYVSGERAVEGFTNLAWTLLLAAGRLVGLPMSGLLTWLGWAFGALSVGLAMALSHQLGGTSEAPELRPWRAFDLRSAVPGLLLATSPHLAVATTNGLESSMFVAGALLAVLTHVRAGVVLAAVRAPEPPLEAAAMLRRARLHEGLALALLPWIRPEGVALAGLLVLHAAWRDRGGPSGWLGPLPSAAWWAGASVGALTTLRLLYYGMLVPNTYFAKSSFPITKTFEVNKGYLDPELELFAAVGACLLLAVLLPPMPTPSTARRGELSGKLITAATALLAAFIPLTVNLWMPGLRLFLPAFALTAALVGGALQALPRVVGFAAGGALLLGMMGAHATTGERIRNYDWRHSAEPGNGAQRAAEHLAAHLPDDAWVAVRDGGVFAYYVTPRARVAELHQRALTLPHPDGKDADVLGHTPINPEVFVGTVRRENRDALEYGNDKAVFRRFTRPYRYLGRVRQHYHRYYDVYVRADLGVPPLPEDLVVNKKGPPPPTFDVPVYDPVGPSLRDTGL